MESSLKIYLFGASQVRLDSLDLALKFSDEMQISRQLLTIDNVVNSFEIPEDIDVVVLDISENWQQELAMFSKEKFRSELIVTGCLVEADIYRSVMKAGARDYLVNESDDVNPASEVYNRVLEIGLESRVTRSKQPRDTNRGSLTAVINAHRIFGFLSCRI